MCPCGAARVPDPLLGERLEAVERAVEREAELLGALETSRAQTEELFTALLEAHARTLARVRRLTATMRGEAEPAASNRNGAASTG